MVGLRQSYFVPCSTGMSRSFPHRRSVRYCINHPWLTTKDWPVRAFDSNAANSSATSATSDSVVNSPSTVSLSITFLTTSSSLMPSSRACSGICLSTSGVRTSPGQITLARMRCLPPSLATVLHSPMEEVSCWPDQAALPGKFLDHFGGELPRRPGNGQRLARLAVQIFRGSP